MRSIDISHAWPTDHVHGPLDYIHGNRPWILSADYCTSGWLAVLIFLASNALAAVQGQWKHGSNIQNTETTSNTRKEHSKRGNNTQYRESKHGNDTQNVNQRYANQAMSLWYRIMQDAEAAHQVTCRRSTCTVRVVMGSVREPKPESLANRGHEFNPSV